MATITRALTVRAVQYTGSNSAEVLDLAELATPVAPWSIQSESGGVLVLEFDQDGPDTCTLNVGDWLVFEPKALFAGAYTDDAFQARLNHPLPLAVSAGSAPVPTLGASAQTTVSVTIAPAQSGDYEAAAHLIGGSGLLADLEILSVTPDDADTVDVVVRNNGLVSLGGATVAVMAVG
jgi:hypothetical protein